MSATSTKLCPNFKRHCDEGARWQKGFAWYKTEERDTAFRRGYDSDAGSCDYCWPPCPTCGHRERRRT